MDLQEVESIVTGILVDKLGISKTEISLGSSMKDLGADSLEGVEIILELEKEFGINIPDEILPEVQNIESLCKYIVQKI